MTRRPVRTLAAAAIAAIALSACTPTTELPEPSKTTPTPTLPTAMPEPTDGTPGDKEQKITATTKQVAIAALYLHYSDAAPEPLGAVKYMADLGFSEQLSKQFNVKYTQMNKNGRPAIRVERKADGDKFELKDVVFTDPGALLMKDYDGITLAMAQITSTDVKDIRKNIPPLPIVE